MDKATALRKIRKCLALSASNEPNEAARALAQAQALMREFNVEHPELLAAGATHDRAKSRATSRPPVYEVHLVNVIAEGFGCEVIFSREWRGLTAHGGYDLIGVAPAPEIASYTFTVLMRKLTAARAAYMAGPLKRYRKNKLAAADHYCVGWVVAACASVLPNQPSGEQAAAIAAYRALHYAGTIAGTVTKRALATPEASGRHKLAGYIDGKDASVQTGMAGTAAPLQLGMF